VHFSRPLAGDGVPLQRGETVPLGVAVWQGALGERAGIKSHTPEWLGLRLAD
jgi:hypothetical protein